MIVKAKTKTKTKEETLVIPEVESRKFTDDELNQHEEALHSMFVTKTRFEFRRLIQRVRELGRQVQSSQVVVDVGRNYPYGGTSLFGPFFAHAKYIGVDSPLANAQERKGYLKGLIPKEGGYIGVQSSLKGKIDEYVPLPTECADYYLVLNIVEHVADPEGMLHECRRILKPGGKALFYVPNVREEHQVPCDYFRYTRYGFQVCVDEVALVTKNVEPVSGIFDVIGMALQHSVNYFPQGEEREVMRRFVHQEMMPKLEEWEERFCSQIGENDRSVPVPERKEFPVAYLFTLTK